MVSGAAAPARAAHSVYAVGIRWAVASAWVAGYGGIRSSSSVAALSCTILRCLARQCSFCLQIASTRRGAFALRCFCFHKTLDILFTYLFIYLIYLFSRTTQHGIVVLALTTLWKCKSTWYCLFQYESEYIRELDTAASSLSLVAVQIKLVQNCTLLRCLARLCPLARSLSANGVHTPLYFSQVAGYGCTCSPSWVAVLSGSIRRCLAGGCSPSRS